MRMNGKRSLALSPGTYQMWVRITGATVQPVLPAGPVVII